VAVPPGAGFLGVVAVDEAPQPHGGRHRQHHGVEPEPREVNPDLLAVILSVDDGAAKHSVSQMWLRAPLGVV